MNECKSFRTKIAESGKMDNGDIKSTHPYDPIENTEKWAKRVYHGTKITDGTKLEDPEFGDTGL